MNDRCCGIVPEFNTPVQENSGSITTTTGIIASGAEFAPRELEKGVEGGVGALCMWGLWRVMLEAVFLSMMNRANKY